MAWYDTGTVNVTNGSTTVVGVGTNFIAGAQVGEGFYGPDGGLYEIQAIVSATSLTLADAYLGATQTGQAYKIVPTQSLVAALATQVSTLISDFQGVVDEAGSGKFNDGTAASAGITFTLDQDTGIFRPAANQIGFTTAGVQRAVVSSAGVDVTGTVTAGDVDITGPTPTLTLTDNDLADENTLILNSSGNTFIDSRNGSFDGQFIVRGKGGGVVTEHFRANANGVGIFNTNPTAPLDVTGSAKISGNLTVDTSTLHVDSSNNRVGVGTVNPDSNLHIRGSSGTTLNIADSDDLGTGPVIQFTRENRFGLTGDSLGKIQFYSSDESLPGASSRAYIQGIMQDQFNRGALTFGTADYNDTETERMRLDSSGQLGIGTSDPSAALDVVGNAKVSSNLAVGSSSPWTTAGSWRSIKLTDRHGIQATPAASSMAISSNTAVGASGYEYTVTGAAAGNYTMSGNLHIWNGAASGTIGGAVTFAEYMRLTSTGLGIGTTNPSAALDVVGDAEFNGDLLVGKTVANLATAGVQLRPATVSSFTQDGVQPLSLNRLTSDGDILTLFKNSGTVGSIGTVGGQVFLATNGQAGLRYKATSVTPCNSGGVDQDNVIDLGQVSIRFDDIYATNGTIQTSDRNEKQDIDVLSAAETAVAQACKGLLRKFRWKDAVAEKGDDARIHFGIIAQDLQDAFTAQGLDAGNYAMFISSTWWEADRIIPAVEAVAEELDEDGNVIVEAVEAVAEQTVTDTFETLEEAPESATERTRLGVRYPELLAFIIGAM